MAEGRPRAEVLVPACNPNSEQTKAGRLPWVFGQPGLNSEFKGSQGSIVRLSQEDRRKAARDWGADFTGNECAG